MAEAVRLHLFYVRYHMWLSIACMFRAHLSSAADRVIFVMSGALRRNLLREGLISPQDGTVAADLPSLLAAHPVAELHVYVQASRTGYRELRNTFLEILNNNSLSASVHLYPDGYTNNTYEYPVLQDILARNSALRMGKTYFFDAPPKRLDAITPTSVSQIISSERLDSFVNIEVCRQAAAREIRASLADSMARDVLLVLMRPWGSPIHAGGRMAFDEAPINFARIMEGVIRRVERDIGSVPHLILRPDPRQPDFCNDVIGALSVAEPTRRFTSIGRDWPDWLTFEPFIFHFDTMAPQRRLHVVSLDSTGSLPFLALGKGQTHYIGVPDSCIPDHLGASPGIRHIRGKIRSLLGWVEALPAGPQCITRFDRHFFRVDFAASSAEPPGRPAAEDTGDRP